MMSTNKRKVKQALYETRFVSKWEQLLALYNKKFSMPAHWVFRGQRKHTDYELATSIERAFREFEPDRPDKRGNRYTCSDLEQALLREFKRKSHIYEHSAPSEDDTLEWLSIMRHYGGSTRLLDCMYSYFAAIYFALRDPYDGFSKYKAEIWAFNAAWFWKKTQEIIRDRHSQYLQNDPELADAVTDPESGAARNMLVNHLMKHPLPLVLNVTPIGLNQRITIQQGTFLAPGDIGRTFVENLNVYADFTGKGPPPICKVRIELDKSRRNEVLRHLHAMNINDATLFLDLSGFAQSLRVQLAFPEKFGLKKKSVSEIDL